MQGSFAYDDEMQKVADLIGEGRLQLAPFVSHRKSLSDITSAFAVQGNAGESLKVLVQP